MWINQNFYLDITIYNEDGQVFNDNCYRSLNCFIVQHMVHTRVLCESAFGRGAYVRVRESGVEWGIDVCVCGGGGGGGG